MSLRVIHLKAANSMIKEIVDEIVMIDRIVTILKGLKGKLIPLLDCHPPLCYMSVIHLKAVTTIVKEISFPVKNYFL